MRAFLGTVAILENVSEDQPHAVSRHPISRTTAGLDATLGRFSEKLQFEVFVHLKNIEQCREMVKVVKLAPVRFRVLVTLRISIEKGALCVDEDFIEQM